MAASLYKNNLPNNCMALTFKYDAERNKNSIKFGGGLLLNENVFLKAKVPFKKTNKKDQRFT